jgi:hypothetical protein
MIGEGKWAAGRKKFLATAPGVTQNSGFDGGNFRVFDGTAFDFLR